MTARCPRRWAVLVAASVREGEAVWGVPWCGMALGWDRWAQAVRVPACIPEPPSAPAVPAGGQAPHKGGPEATERPRLSRRPAPHPSDPWGAPAGGLPHRVAHTKWGTARRSGAQGGPRGATAHKAVGRGAGDGRPLRGASTPLHRAIRRGVDGRRRTRQWVASFSRPSLESHPVGALGLRAVHDHPHGLIDETDAPRHGVCVKGRSARVCNTLGNPRWGRPAEPREGRSAGVGCGSIGGCPNPLGNPRGGGLSGR